MSELVPFMVRGLPDLYWAELGCWKLLGSVCADSDRPHDRFTTFHPETPGVRGDRAGYAHHELVHVDPERRIATYERAGWSWA